MICGRAGRRSAPPSEASEASRSDLRRPGSSSTAAMRCSTVSRPSRSESGPWRSEKPAWSWSGPCPAPLRRRPRSSPESAASGLSACRSCSASGPSLTVDLGEGCSADPTRSEPWSSSCSRSRDLGRGPGARRSLRRPLKAGGPGRRRCPQLQCYVCRGRDVARCPGPSSGDELCLCPIMAPRRLNLRRRRCRRRWPAAWSPPSSGVVSGQHLQLALRSRWRCSC